ncbi:MAG: hypothetical protein IIX18_05220, partial [Clostridia bacterium]|nr:hypothetical protein [Clostridia bacterium]
ASHTLEELEEMTPEERKALLLPVEDAFCDLESIKLPDFFARLARNGCEVYQKKLGTSHEVGKLLRLYDKSGFFGLGEVREFEEGTAIKTVKLFSLN